MMVERRSAGGIAESSYLDPCLGSRERERERAQAHALGMTQVF